MAVAFSAGEEKGPLAGGRREGVSHEEHTATKRREEFGQDDRMGWIYRIKWSVALIHEGNVNEEEMMRYCKGRRLL